MLNPPSPDISTLSATAVWDISGVSPAIIITNTSTGSGLANVTWWFVANSPSQTPIHSGSELVPDINGDWTTHTLSDSWPRPYGQIEWSGAPYTMTMYAKDSAGTIYSYEFSGASICRPFGNTQKSNNPYGLASVDIQLKCEMGRILFQNTTNVSYKGIEGEMNASTLKVLYPMDETQTLPDPFAITSFSTAMVPITYSSDNYQFVTQQYYTYNLGGDSSVKIRYQLQKRFPVYCNINLLPLVCEYQKLVESLELGNCQDSEKASQQLMVINSKMAMVFIGMMQPLTGVDVPALIKQIEDIGEFECDCCNAPSGIIPTTASIIDGYAFSVVKDGGDVQGNFEKVGNNIVLHLSDKTYVFNISAATLSQTDAFSVIPSDSGSYTKIYSLNVDLATLAEDLAGTIEDDPSLYNLWKTLFGIGATAEIIVDGGCIFQSSSACNYEFTMTGIPASGTYAIFSSITVGGSPVAKSYSFNLTNLAAFQTYLNGMGYGTFSVTNPSGSTVLVTSNANTNNLGGMTYKISATTYNADFNRECTGYAAITLNEFAAYIVNFICQLNDSNIVTGKNYEVCYIDGLGQKQITVLDAGVSIQTLFDELTLRGCSTIDYVKGLGAVNCASVKEIFTSNSSLQITGADFLLGTKGGGVCSRPSYADAFLAMLNFAKSNVTILNTFCEVVTMCGAGLACEPFSYFELLVTDYDTVCTEAVGIEYTLS